VEVFDCTAEGAVPGFMRDRVKFHRLCLGDPKYSDPAAGRVFLPLKDIMHKLGHRYVTLLKVDIEGFEFDLFMDDLLAGDTREGSAGGRHLPEQIVFELHYQTQMKELSWFHREKTAGELALLAERMYLAGYRLLAREDNPYCGHCSEMTLARFLCPAAAGGLASSSSPL
jgi:hypothetical protein